MKNDYEIRGDVTAIFITSKKYGRVEALISTVDLNKANELPNSWRASWRPDLNNFYCYGNTPMTNGKINSVSLHRWLTDAPEGKSVDHINHDTLNNTVENMRLVNHYENSQNRKGANRNSKSGIRGVSWHKQSNKWRVQIQVNGMKKHLGSFHDICEAEDAATAALDEYMPYSNEGAIA